MTLTLITTKSGNTSNMNMHKHLTTQHVIDLHKLNVFDMMVNLKVEPIRESISDIENGIGIAKFDQFLSLLTHNTLYPDLLDLCCASCLALHC